MRHVMVQPLQSAVVVDGTQPGKGPVDKFSGDQGGVAHLGTPAQKGIDKKYSKETVQHDVTSFAE